MKLKMRNILEKETGITLMVLVITIIVLLIIASIGIRMATGSMSNVRENKELSELNMVQHAVLERYTKSKVTDNSSILPGTAINISEAQNIATQIGVTLLDTANYYELNKARVKRFRYYRYR